MGLDWCVKEKERPGITEFLVEQARVRVGEAEEALSAAWAAWLAASGEESPLVWPNPTYTAFCGSEVGKKLRGVLTEAETTLGECLVSPMETLGAPRVGIDEVATAFARSNYQQLMADSSTRVSQTGLTEEDYLRQEHGAYVPHLVQSDGVPSVSGIAVGAESFRAKLLNYSAAVLEGTDLQERAYQDHTALELLVLAADLDAAADSYEGRMQYEEEWQVEHAAGELKEAWMEMQREECDDPDTWPDEPDFEAQAREARRPMSRSAAREVEESQEKLNIVREAARWCRFWGSHGHSMHAWY